MSRKYGVVARTQTATIRHHSPVADWIVAEDWLEREDAVEGAKEYRREGWLARAHDLFGTRWMILVLWPRQIAPGRWAE